VGIKSHWGWPCRGRTTLWHNR